MLTSCSRQPDFPLESEIIARPRFGRRLARNALRLLCVLAISLAALAAASSASAEQWTKKYTVSGRPSIHVATDDGNINILPGPAGEIQADVQAEGYSIPGDVHVSESQVGDAVRLDVKVPSMHFHLFGGSHTSVAITVHVPSGSDLDVSSGDGNVTAQPVSGNIHITTGDGNITVTGLKGNLKLHTGDGHIQGADLDGTLAADTGDGRVQVRGRFDSLNLKSGDGSIDADALAGSKIPEGGGWTLHTGDGRVNLRLPADFTADLSVHTGDGHISLDFPVTVAGSLSGSSIHGKMNGGGGPLTVTSGDGSIRIEKI
jgi:DUF4097 and DUF4098 domain-containing protein YvlB